MCVHLYVLPEFELFKSLRSCLMHCTFIYPNLVVAILVIRKAKCRYYKKNKRSSRNKFFVKKKKLFVYAATSKKFNT